LRAQNADAGLVGTVVAERYNVLSKLGEGGMGAVYLAEHVKMGRKSAIKVMTRAMSQEPDAIARFHREAANASRMNHPNICAIYDFGETQDGLIYLAMEYVEGEALTRIIERNGTLPPARVSPIVRQVADALQVAHEHGVVHRDLKPDNIMITRGRDHADLVKVVDFGIAKAQASDGQNVTRTGMVVGTPEYMSPEQLAGDVIDGRSDVYSLGLVAFKMLTGTLPFPSKSAQEAMIMRLTTDPKTLADLKPEVAWTPEVQRALDRALARDPEQRHASAAEFGREFTAAIALMPGAAVAEASTQALAAGGATFGGTATGASTLPPTRVSSHDATGMVRVRARRKPGVIAGTTVVVLVALGITAAMINGAREGRVGGARTETVTDTGGRGGEQGRDSGAVAKGAAPPPMTLAGRLPTEAGRAGPAGKVNPVATDSVRDADVRALEEMTNPANTDSTKSRRGIARADSLLERPMSDALEFRVKKAKAEALVASDPSGACAIFRELNVKRPNEPSIRMWLTDLCG
jgi:hypothetical protein